MNRPRLKALLVLAAVSGCSALNPYATSPHAGVVGVKDPGPRVAVCYNALKTPPEQVQKLAQEQCFGETVAQQVNTDYSLDACPALAPGRATFVCAPKPKPK